MLLPRGLYSSSPPDPRSREQNNPTLLFSWWCTCFSLTIVAIRLIGRMVRNNQLFKEDKIMFFALVPLLIRMALVHMILIWGTNNIDTSKGLGDLDILHRSIGSRLVLAARIFYAMYIWTAKFTVSEFLKRLTSNFWKREYELALQIIRGFLIATFFAVVIATLAECQPFTHYWQVIPDPGPQCRQGYAQLLTMGTADMITDVLLIIFPIPIVLRSSAFKIKRKIQLILLFSLSAVLVGITGYRVQSVISHNGRQQYRSVFASGEILAATAVSNAVVIGSFLRDRGVKKQKYKHSSSNNSTTGPSTRRHTMAMSQLNNDSDSDLFRDMCYRTASELEKQPEPRAPSIAVPNVAESDGKRASDAYFMDSNPGIGRDSEESGNITAVERPPNQSQDARTAPPRKRIVSFSDPGGLLDDVSSRSSTIAPSPSTTSAQDFASPASGRRGSRNYLSELGGLLSPILSSNRVQTQEDIQESPDPLTMMTPALPSPARQQPNRQSLQSLQDIGGLLDSPASPSSSGRQPRPRQLSTPDISPTTTRTQPYGP